LKLKESASKIGYMRRFSLPANPLQSLPSAALLTSCSSSSLMKKAHL